MLAIGTELVGTTTQHPGRIEIIGRSKQKYRVRFCGGQHDGKAVKPLMRYVVERYYRVVKRPKR